MVKQHYKSVALVSRSSKGIGKAIAQEFVMKGLPLLKKQRVMN